MSNEMESEEFRGHFYYSRFEMEDFFLFSSSSFFPPITCSAFRAGSFFWVALYDNVCTLLALSCSRSRIEQLTN